MPKTEQIGFGCVAEYAERDVLRGEGRLADGLAAVRDALVRGLAPIADEDPILDANVLEAEHLVLHLAGGAGLVGGQLAQQVHGLIDAVLHRPGLHVPREH